MIHGKYRYTHLSSGDLLRDEVGVMCSCLLTVRLLILRRIFEQNKMRIRRNVMKVKMMVLIFGVAGFGIPFAGINSYK